MKAIRNYKLAALTGFAALGVVGAGVAHAQSPSGPITTAPAQQAPAATAQNSAPLPPPRTTILGAWKFNPDDSDDPRKRRQDSQDPNGGYGGGRGRMGGGDSRRARGLRGGAGGGGKETRGGEKGAATPPRTPHQCFSRCEG